MPSPFDPLDDSAEFRAYAEHALTDMIPHLDNSMFAIAITPRKPENYSDIKFCLELGAMVMMDKPIIAVVPPGTKVPNKLVLIADAIVELDQMDPSFQTRLMAEIKRIMAEIGAGNGPEHPDQGGRPDRKAANKSSRAHRTPQKGTGTVRDSGDQGTGEATGEGA